MKLKALGNVCAWTMGHAKAGEVEGGSKNRRLYDMSDFRDQCRVAAVTNLIYGIIIYGRRV